MSVNICLLLLRLALRISICIDLCFVLYLAGIFILCDNCRRHFFLMITFCLLLAHGFMYVYVSKQSEKFDKENVFNVRKLKCIKSELKWNASQEKLKSVRKRFFWVRNTILKTVCIIGLTSLFQFPDYSTLLNVKCLQINL